MDTKKLLLIILSVLLPPAAVFMGRGLGKDFLINLILTIFFFVPGMIHSLYLTMK